MKKILIVLAKVLFLLVIIIIFFGEHRRFYCVGGNKCVTVWKLLGGKCYVIPGKYYGLINMSDNYIITTNLSLLDCYWSEELPNTLIVRFGSSDYYKIINKNKNNIKIIDYSNSMEGIFYKKGATRMDEIKSNASLMMIYVDEDYAMDRNGKHL